MTADRLSLFIIVLTLAAIAAALWTMRFDAVRARTFETRCDSLTAVNKQLQRDLYQSQGQEQFFADEGKLQRRRFLYFAALRGHKKDYLLWEQGYGITKEGKNDKR